MILFISFMFKFDIIYSLPQNFSGKKSRADLAKIININFTEYLIHSDILLKIRSI